LETVNIMNLVVQLVDNGIKAIFKKGNKC